MRFVDMCSVEKVSIVLLPDRYHGYYLHCDAAYEVSRFVCIPALCPCVLNACSSFQWFAIVLQFADGPIEDLVQHLSDEEGLTRVGRYVTLSR